MILINSRAHPFVAWLVGAVIALGAMMVATPQAHAVKVMFGTQSTLEKIQDSTIKGPNGEALYLDHRLSIHSFIASYRLTDDGYTLGIVGHEAIAEYCKALAIAPG